MTLPNRIVPGATLMSTRRTSERRRFFRPDRKYKQLFPYAFALAAKKYGIKLHAIMMMSNHAHVMLTDPHGEVSRFTQFAHRTIATTFNTEECRREAVFSSDGTNYVVMESASRVAEEICYTLSNPVKDACVRSIDLWPGFYTPLDWYGRTVTIPRPAWFQGSKAWPETVELTLEVPPMFGDICPADFGKLLEPKLAAREETERQKVIASGRTFLGRKKVMSMSRYSKPKDDEPKGELRQVLAEHDLELRLHMIYKTKEFRRRYREAYERWKEGGDTPVVFPYGTYKMRNYPNVIIEGEEVTAHATS